MTEPNEVRWCEDCLYFRPGGPLCALAVVARQSPPIMRLFYDCLAVRKDEQKCGMEGRWWRRREQPKEQTP
jgi:hypothetical protein